MYIHTQSSNVQSTLTAASQLPALEPAITSPAVQGMNTPERPSEPINNKPPQDAALPFPAFPALPAVPLHPLLLVM